MGSGLHLHILNPGIIGVYMEQLHELFQKMNRSSLLQQLVVYLIVLWAFFLSAATASAQVTPITIRAGRLLDGVGGVTENVTITVEGSRIIRLDDVAGSVD